MHIFSAGSRKISCCSAFYLPGGIYLLQEPISCREQKWMRRERKLSHGFRCRLFHSNLNKLKALQKYNVTRIHNGCYLVGFKGTGKSTFYTLISPLVLNTRPQAMLSISTQLNGVTYASTLWPFYPSGRDQEPAYKCLAGHVDLNSEAGSPRQTLPPITFIYPITLPRRLSWQARCSFCILIITL